MQHKQLHLHKFDIQKPKGMLLVSLRRSPSTGVLLNQTELQGNRTSSLALWTTLLLHSPHKCKMDRQESLKRQNPIEKAGGHQIQSLFLNTS